MVGSLHVFIHLLSKIIAGKDLCFLINPTKKDLTHKLKTIKYCYIFSYITALNQSKFNFSHNTSVFLGSLGQLNSKEYSIGINVQCC